MAEFVVGQWVEAWGKTWRIIQAEQTRSKLDGNGESAWWCNHGEMKPFVWQVGKTYRTTLEGVTAKIKRHLPKGDPLGIDSRDSEDSWCWVWCKRTGFVNYNKDDASGVHLLPFLADEPSEPVAGSRYVKEKGQKMITEQEALSALKGWDDRCQDYIFCSLVVIEWARQELARREAERVERAKPITAEFCKAFGAVVTSPTLRRMKSLSKYHIPSAFFRIPDAHNLNVYLDPDDSYVAYSDKSIPGVTTMGQLLDLLAAMKGGGE